MAPPPAHRYDRWPARVRRLLAWPARSAVGAPRVIVVDLCWRLGDEVMALPVLEALRTRYPADHIAVLVNHPVLFAGHPFVDSVNDVPRPPDRCLLLRGVPRTVPRINAYARNAGVPVPRLRPHLFWDDWHTPQLAQLPEGPGPLIALAPGAGWPTKRWPAPHWQALADVLRARGCRVFELGLADESAGVSPSLCGQTDVRAAACVLHACDLCIACDSGLLHLALAAHTPAVGLFGPTDPEILIQDEPNFFAVPAKRRCAAPWNVPGPGPARGQCPEGPPCMASISVDAVVAAVERRLLLPPGA